MTVLYDFLAGSITIVAGENDVIKFNEGATLRTATIAPGTYYLYGQSVAAEAAQLNYAIKQAMDTAASTATYTINYAATITTVTGTVTIQSSSGNVQLIASGSTFPFAVLGFPQADSAASTTITSTLSPSLNWWSDQPTVRVDPHAIERDVAQNEDAEGRPHTVLRSEPMVRYRLEYRVVAGDRTWRRLSTADEARSIEAWIGEVADGRPVRLFRTGASNLTTLVGAHEEDTVVLRSSSIASFTARRQVPGADFFAFELDATRHVA